MLVVGAIIISFYENSCDNHTNHKLFCFVANTKNYFNWL